MITHCWILSYPARTQGCGTKNPTRTKSSATMEMKSGTSRFTLGSSLGREELGQGGLPERQEQHTGHDGDDEENLHGVRGLEAPQELGVLREIRAGRVVLLADERVVARHHEERELVDVGRAGDLDRADLVSRFRQEQRLREEGAQEEVRRGAIAEH